MISMNHLVLLIFLAQTCHCKMKNSHKQSGKQDGLLYVSGNNKETEEFFSGKSKSLNRVDPSHLMLHENSSSKKMNVEKQVYLSKRVKRTARNKSNGLKQLGSDRNKRMERNSFPNLKHFCKSEMHQKIPNFTYECKPYFLWNRVPSTGMVTDNNIQNKTGSENSNEISILQFRELYFPHDVITVTDDAIKRWKIPHNVTSLQLRKQNIRILKRRPFFFLKNTLVILRLDSNLIIHISESVFADLNNLVELDLSQNHLHLLHRHLFDGLSNLETLKLAHNQLEFIGERTLGCVGSLSYLDLSNNFLTDIHENAFCELRDSRSIVINIRNNRLSQPRSGWLILPRSSSTTCPGGRSSNLTNIFANSTESMLRTRILWGEGNPWQCTCKSSSGSLAFLKSLIVLRYSLGNERFPDDDDHRYHSEDPESCFLASQDLYRVRWDLILPCLDLEPQWGEIDLGFPIQAAVPVNNSCCLSSDIQETNPLLARTCQYMSEWIKTNAPNSGQNGTHDDEGLTNNQVTIIGIIIVVLSPVLLTLCPQCNRSPSSTEQSCCKNSNNPQPANRENNRSSFLYIKSFPKSAKTVDEEKT